MALNTPQALDTGASTATNNDVVTSGSFTPSARALLVVAVVVTDDDEFVNTISISSTHTGLLGAWTGTQAELQGSGGSERLRLAVFWRQVGATPSAGTVTATCIASRDRLLLRPMQVTTNNAGTSASAEAASPATNSVTSSSTMTVTLPVAPGSADYTLGFAGSWNDGDASGASIEPGSGFTQLTDDWVGTKNADRTSVFSEYRTGSTSTSVGFSSLSTSSSAPSVGAAIIVEEIPTGAQHAQSFTDQARPSDTSTREKGRAQAPTDQARPVDSRSYARGLGRTDQSGLADTLPVVHLNGTPIDFRTGTLNLQTVWLNLASDLTDMVSFPSMASLSFAKAAQPEVRRLAGGRHRLLRRVGDVRTFSLSLPGIDRDQVAWLEGHVGDVVCVRDDRGRKVYGTYTQVEVQEYSTRPDLAAASLTLVEVHHAEAVIEGAD